jgi:hypothetical protein
VGQQRRHEGGEIDLLALGVDAGAFESLERGGVLFLGDLVVGFELVEARHLVRDRRRRPGVGGRGDEPLEVGNLVGNHLDLDAQELHLRRGFLDLAAFGGTCIVFEPSALEAEFAGQLAEAFRGAARVEGRLGLAEVLQSDADLLEPPLGPLELAFGLGGGIPHRARRHRIDHFLGRDGDRGGDGERVLGGEGAHLDGDDAGWGFDVELDPVAPVPDELFEGIAVETGQPVDVAAGEPFAERDGVVELGDDRRTFEVVDDNHGVLGLLESTQARQLRNRVRGSACSTHHGKLGFRGVLVGRDDAEIAGDERGRDETSADQRDESRPASRQGAKQTVIERGGIDPGPYENAGPREPRFVRRSRCRSGFGASYGPRRLAQFVGDDLPATSRETVRRVAGVRLISRAQFIRRRSTRWPGNRAGFGKNIDRLVDCRVSWRLLPHLTT